MKNNIDLLIGKKIKKARLEKEYTLEYIAKKVGLKQASTIGHYENGRRSVSIEMLIKICDVLDIDYKRLLDDVTKSVK